MYSHGFALATLTPILTGQCFSGEHLGSFLPRTGRLEKRKMFSAADFEDVMKLRTKQHVGEQKLAML
jgi:hypothetical protein